MMRPTILGSLLDAARHNVARNGPDVAIFESGTVYRLASADGSSPVGPVPGIHEHHGLGVLLSGRLEPRSWRGSDAEADFFAAKALLEALLGRLGVPFAVRAHPFPYLHPGRSAAVVGAPGGGGEGARRSADRDGAPAGEVALGWLGELHPSVAAGWDLPHAATGGRTAAFAVDVGKLAALAPPVRSFRAFGPFPPLRQDIAVTLPDRVPAAELLERVREAAGDVLEDARVFDVYTGEQVGEGRRSLALALSFRAIDRTLTDEDVAPKRERIVAAVRAIGGELRG
jgi:phenylalanyl-tRNA synthetase beta chain